LLGFLGQLDCPTRSCSGRPRFALRFTVTPGAPVLPPPGFEQAQQSVRRLSPAGALTVTPPFAGVSEPMAVSGAVCAAAYCWQAA
jgi:hypothetical protein